MGVWVWKLGFVSREALTLEQPRYLGSFGNEICDQAQQIGVVSGLQDSGSQVLGVWGYGVRGLGFGTSTPLGLTLLGAGFFRVAQSADVLPDLIVRYVRESQEP